MLNSLEDSRIGEGNHYLLCDHLPSPYLDLVIKEHANSLVHYANVVVVCVVIMDFR